MNRCRFIQSLLILSVLVLIAPIGSLIVQAQACPPTRLVIGQQGRVTPGLAINMRVEASTQAEFVGQIAAGETFTVLDGPRCVDGYSWWQIDYNGLVGWAAEGVSRDYWLEPLGTVPPTPTLTLTPVPAPNTTPTPFPPRLLERSEAGQILFVSAASQIMVIDGDGENVRQLSSGYAHSDPVWSPDGDEIAFASFQGGDGSQGVFIQNAGGGRLRQIGDDVLRGIDVLAWSPDGRYLAFIGFVSEGDPNTAYSDIFTANITTGEMRNLTRVEGQIYGDYFPEWSPDSQALLFLSEREGMTRVFRVDIESGAVVSITPPGVFSSTARWSPDGQQLAYDVLLPENRSEIYLASAAGDDPVRLVDNGSNPFWSPDGTQLLYSLSRYDDQTGIGYAAIHVLTLESGEVREILPESTLLPEGLAWSSDRSRLAFIARDPEHEDGRYDLYLMDADGSNVTRIYEGVEPSSYPRWRPEIKD